MTAKLAMHFVAPSDVRTNGFGMLAHVRTLARNLQGYSVMTKTTETKTTKTVLVSSGTYVKGDKQFNSQTRSFYKIDKKDIGTPIRGTVLRVVTEAR